MFTDYSTLTLEQLHQLKGQVGQAAQDKINQAILEKATTPAKQGKWTSEDEPEKEIQRRICERLKKLGAAVYWLSQPRESGQTAGVPDLVVFDPARGMFWIECKAAGGKQSEEQKRFQTRCELAGVPYVIGGLTEVEQFLKGEVIQPEKT